MAWTMTIEAYVIGLTTEPGWEQSLSGINLSVYLTGKEDVPSVETLVQLLMNGKRVAITIVEAEHTDQDVMAYYYPAPPELE